MFKVVLYKNNERKRAREGRQRFRFGASLECRRSKREREAEKERLQQEQWITIKHVPDREFAGNKVMEQKRGMMKSINQSIETRKRE